jgi:hypothetical protein
MANALGNDNEYLLLPSNVSTDLYAENSSSAYTVMLSNHLQLKGRYQAGAANIILPTKWCNVKSDSDSFEVREFVASHTGEKIITYTYPDMISVTISAPPKTFGTWKGNKISITSYKDWFFQQMPANAKNKVTLGITTHPLPPETTKREIEVRFLVVPPKSKIRLKEPYTFWQVFNFPRSYIGNSYEDYATGRVPTFIKPEICNLDYLPVTVTETDEVIEDFTDGVTCRLPHDRYDNNEKFIELLNTHHPKKIQHGIQEIPVDYGFKLGSGGKVNLKLGSRTSIRIAPLLAQLLGGLPTGWLAKGSSHKAERMMNLDDDGVSAFVIYCDLVRYSYIGNIRGPMMEVVCPENRKSAATDVTPYRPPNIHYYDINSNFISSAHVYIKDQSGNAVKFIGGLTLVNVHLKKVSD